MKGDDRFSTDRIRVSCACCGREHRIVNLGLGGFFVAGPLHPHAERPIVYRIELPGREPFHVTGVIAWTNPEDRSKAPNLPEGYGVRIQQIGLAEKLALLGFLRECDSRQTH